MLGNVQNAGALFGAILGDETRRGMGNRQGTAARGRRRRRRHAQPIVREWWVDVKETGKAQTTRRISFQNPLLLPSLLLPLLLSLREFKRDSDRKVSLVHALPTLAQRKAGKNWIPLNLQPCAGSGRALSFYFVKPLHPERICALAVELVLVHQGRGGFRHPPSPGLTLET